MKTRLQDLSETKVTPSNKVITYPAIRFTQISVPLVICEMSELQLVPPDFRISFQFCQRDLELAETFSDYNEEFKAHSATANALFMGQQFIIPVRVSSMLPGDMIVLRVYMGAKMMQQFSLPVFAEKMGIPFFNAGEFTFYEGFTQIAGSLLAPTDNIVFSQELDLAAFIQNTKTFMNYKTPEIVPTAVFDSIVRNYVSHGTASPAMQSQNTTNPEMQMMQKDLLAPLVEQRKAAHIQEVLKSVELPASLAEDYLVDAIMPPRMQFLEQNASFDVLRIMSEDPNRIIEELSENTASTRIFQETTPNVSFQALQTGVSAFFSDSERVSCSYTATDYCWEQKIIQLHNNPQYGRELTQPNDNIIEEIREIISQYIFEPIENPEFLVDNRDYLLKIPNSFGYLTKAMIQLHQLDIEFLGQYENVPLDELFYFLSYKTAGKQSLRNLVIGFLYKVRFEELKEFMPNLINCMRFDENSELADFFLNELTSVELLEEFALLPFYVQQCCQTSQNVPDEHKYVKVLESYLEAVSHISAQYAAELNKTMAFVAEMREICAAVKQNDADRLTQIKCLEQELERTDKYPLMTGTESVLFPFLSAPTRVCGVQKHKFHVFKSAKKPLLLYLQCEGGKIQPLLLKYNDDVRNDQIVMQEFVYFDQQLRDKGLQMETSMYCAFAFDAKFGIVECVRPSVSIDDIILDKEVQSIQRYLRGCERERIQERDIDEKVINMEEDIAHARVSSAFVLPQQVLGHQTASFSVPGRAESADGRNEHSETERTFESGYERSEMTNYTPGPLERSQTVSMLIAGKNEQLTRSAGPKAMLESPTVIHDSTMAQSGHGADDTKTLNPQELDRLTKSTAFYSAATYILAVGDRHLENILMRPDGRLFHIDYGWIFGRDPKPRAAQMKLSPEMISAMGGVDGTNFMRFMSYLVNCYLIIRRCGDIIYSSLTMLKGSGIAVIEQDEPGNFEWLQIRLNRSMGDDEVSSTVVQLVLKQLNAVFPRVIDALHRWVQQQRK